MVFRLALSPWRRCLAVSGETLAFLETSSIWTVGQGRGGQGLAAKFGTLEDSDGSEIPDDEVSCQASIKVQLVIF